MHSENGGNMIVQEGFGNLRYSLRQAEGGVRLKQPLWGCLLCLRVADGRLCLAAFIRTFCPPFKSEGVSEVTLGVDPGDHTGG